MDECGIEHHAQYIAVDCRNADTRMWSERTRAFAVACIEQKANRVLIDATDCDPDGHYALRDALTTIILVGVPSGFRLALVTNVSRLQALFGTLQRDLQWLQIPARCFAEDSEALAWLVSAPATRAAATHAGARPEA